MKSLVEYITDITGEDQEAIMKPMRIMAEQHGQDEALWNTEQDRWSRRAKHPLRVNEVSTEDELTWEKGEMAIYGSSAVEVSIPNGPNGTVGIVFEGKTKMVLSNKLAKIEEGVMGGMQPLNPLNRMMQLAGISASSVIDEKIEPINEVQDPMVQKIMSDFNTMLNSISSAPNPSETMLQVSSAVLTAMASHLQSMESNLGPQASAKVKQMSGILVKLAHDSQSAIAAQEPKKV